MPGGASGITTGAVGTLCLVTVYEKSGTVSATASVSGFAMLGGAATAMIGVGLKMMLAPPTPEPGYHLAHGHHDVVGGAVVFGLGVAALYASFRAFLDAKDIV